MDKEIVDFHEYLMGDVFGHIAGVTSKKMFGGYGLYLDDAIFAIITSDSEVYFKVDESNKAQFEERGSEPFVYTGHTNKKPTTMPYWLLPEEILEGDKEVLTDWVVQSAEISRTSKK